MKETDQFLVNYIGVDFSKECIRMATQHSSAGVSPARYQKTLATAGGYLVPHRCRRRCEVSGEDIVSSSLTGLLI